MPDYPTCSDSSSKKKYCGKDVTQALKKLMANFHKEAKSDAGVLLRMCHGRFAKGNGWDICELAHAKKEFTDDECRPRCPGTVLVNNLCMPAEAVNYVLWGWIGRMCHSFLGGAMPGGMHHLALESLVELHRWNLSYRNQLGEGQIIYTKDPTGAMERIAWTREGYGDMMLLDGGPIWHYEQIMNDRSHNKRLWDSLQDCEACGDVYDGNLTARVRISIWPGYPLVMFPDQDSASVIWQVRQEGPANTYIDRDSSADKNCDRGW
ncbi:MAG: hypothetical protein J0L64_28515 [Acidobacteria bacterium]|nr:hypothetical protein [Acidobacteriota bacterium]